MTNLARFTIAGTPSSQRGYDVDPGATPALQLEGSASLVGRTTFEVYSASDPLSPRCSPGAPVLTLTGSTSGQSVDATTPGAVVTVSAGMPSVRAPHAWMVRCKVDGGVKQDGSVDPDKVFERLMVMRSVLGRRKILPGERDEYSPTESWASAVNDLADESETDLGAPGLVDVIDANYGISLYGGKVASWRGRLGCVARPLVASQSLLTYGTRQFVEFNGTTHGMLIAFPGLMRATRSLSIHVHGVALDDSARAQTLVSLRSTDLSVARLTLNHSAYQNIIASGSNSTVAATSATGWEANQERVWSAVRDVSGATAYVNGASVATASASTSEPLSDYVYLTIGHKNSGEYFSGAIRRIAIYTVPHTASDVAAIDALWRGK